MLYEKIVTGEEKLALVGLGYVGANCSCLCEKRCECNWIRS